MSQKDDLISRKAAINAAKEELDNGTYYDIPSKIEYLPSAEPERKKPDHGYMWICPECGLEVHSDFRRCVRCGWDRPSAEPEWKKGRWIPHEYKEGWNYGFNCSVCGEWFVIKLEKPKFCPNCGADMRGEEDGQG